MSPLNRRAWMRLAPALGTLFAIEDEMFAQVSPEAPQPKPLAKHAIVEALAIAGLELPEKQIEMMVAGVNRNRNSYGVLRGVRIPLDTEPAIRFDPRLPGRRARTGPGRFRLSPAARVRRPASVEDLAFAPVTELAAYLRQRAVTSTDLTKMYLARLKRYGPRLNCVVTLTEDLALEQAARADREIGAGKYRGPLHGIPWGAKDLFATKGIPATWGTEVFREQVFEYDAAVVERLERAGAVLVGKLSMGELAQGGLWFGGMTRTPWNLERSSSGSSAGSASATAAGLVGFGLGTETLGSIVSPCVACGVTGLRPTFGRVSRAGAMALSWTMDKIGPICRAVEDCAIVLDAIRGPDGKDLSVVDEPFDWTPDQPLSALRVGISKPEFDKSPENAKPLYEAALNVLEKLGVKSEPVEFPAAAADSIRIVLVAEAAAQFDDFTRDGGGERMRGQNAGDWPNTFRVSRLIPAVEYIRAQRARTLLMRAMDGLMARYDVIVSPFGRNLTVTNLTGHPQVVIPCGFIGDQPRGLLFTGRLYEEGAPLRLALAWQRATEWHLKHPKVDWA